MPVIVAFCRGTDAMFDVQLPTVLPIAPSRERSFAIIRVDRLEPAKTETLLVAKAREVHPPAAYPDARAVRLAAEDELRDTYHERAHSRVARRERMRGAHQSGM